MQNALLCVSQSAKPKIYIARESKINALYKFNILFLLLSEKIQYFCAKQIKMSRIYEFSFIPKHLAYMMQDKTKRYWYLYIRNNEVGIVTETNRRLYIYDYSRLENIYAGNNMLALANIIRKLYNLFNNVSRGTQ